MRLQSRTLNQIAFFGILGLLVLSGCRTYGGQGTEEAYYMQIEETNRQFAEELRRAESDLNLLMQTAQEDPRLTPLQGRFEQLLVVHEALLESHQELEEELDSGSSHRRLSRSLGAIVAEQRMMRDQYLRAKRAVTRFGEPAESFPPQRFNMGLYKVSPMFYHQLLNRPERQLTMRQALAMAAEEADSQANGEIFETDDLDEGGETGEVPADTTS